MKNKCQECENPYTTHIRKTRVQSGPHRGEICIDMLCNFCWEVMRK
jgi:hypothetical protein